mgnify:CR=1 FL=1
MNKIISFYNIENHQKKINKIKKYSSNRDFWYDFNYKKNNFEDKNYFILLLEKEILKRYKSYENSNVPTLYFKAMWDLSAKRIGLKATSNKILIYIFEKIILKKYEKKYPSRKWVNLANIIYDSLITHKRINNFNKLKVFKIY